MDLHALITKAIERTGTIRALADLLDQAPSAVSDAKRGQRGLPAYACVRLARIIGEDADRVIAASELVTEKDPERRADWLPFVQDSAPPRAMAEAKATARKVAKDTFSMLSRSIETS